jgi:hypothetical protein
MPWEPIFNARFISATRPKRSSAFPAQQELRPGILEARVNSRVPFRFRLYRIVLFRWSDSRGSLSHDQAVRD